MAGWGSDIWGTAKWGATGWAFVQGIGTASWTTGVGTAANAGSAVTSAPTLVFGSNNAANNLLIAAAVTNNTGGVTMTISDTRSNTWQHKTVVDVSNSTQIDLFYCQSCAAGANTITFNTGTAMPYWEYAAFEYSGGNNPTLESSGTISEGSTTTVHSVSTAAGLTAGDLLFSLYGDSPPATETFSAQTGTERTYDCTQLSYDAQDLMSSSAGTATMSTTQSPGGVQGVMIILAFKAGAVASAALLPSSFRQRVPMGRAALR